jgi:hypothetical protein
VANTNKPSGFTPVKYLNGADWDGRGNVYFLSRNDATAIYVGDPVTINTTLANADTVHGLPSVQIGAAGAVWAGIVLGVGTQYNGPYVDPTNLTLTYAPATKTQDYFLLVADDPMIVFEVQEGAPTYGLGAAFNSTMTSANANAVIHAPAVTGLGWSGTVLDRGTVPVATAGLNVRLLGLSQKYDNGALNTYGAYAKWLCKINMHQFGTVVGTVGVVSA